MKHKIIRGFFTAIESDNYLNLLKQYSNYPFYQFNQVHGAKIKIYDATTSQKETNKLEPYDGAMISKPGIIIIKTADCIPLQLFDKKKNWIAQLHCGWKSVRSGIIENLFKIINLSDQSTSTLTAFLGPSICRDCYEVGPEILTAFNPLIKRYNLNTNDFFSLIRTNKNKYLFNLKNLIVKILTNNRISLENIEIDNDCTYCKSQYYSFRFNKTAKRNISYIGLV